MSAKKQTVLNAPTTVATDVNLADYLPEGMDGAELRREMLAKYPAKIARKREKQMIENEVNPEGEVPEIGANSRSVPGIITQRGCTYAGCKGVVVGPTRDILQIVHGPIGCSYYAWLTRRNMTKPESTTEDNFMTYCLSTDMQDSDIVFGGEKKLIQAIREAYEIFHPKVIAVFSTCPVGLIGDDVHAVSRKMSEELGITVFGMSCEGYKGVSQSAGHHIANNAVFQHVVGKNQTMPEGKFKINMLGEYNIGGDSYEIEALFKEMGVTLVSTFSGNSTAASMGQAPFADLDVVMCHRSINYMAEMLEKKFGIPWFKVNFIGAKATAKSLRHIAEYYGDKELMAQVDKIVTRELAKVEAVIAEIKPKLAGKTVMMYVGGSRAHHYQELFKELGMVVLSAGYEFAHRDDYEGRKVLPNVKVDADSRNIEEIEVTADPVAYNPRRTPEQLAELSAKGIPVNDYEGMMPDMPKGALIIDDISHYETEKLIEMLKPNLICAGIKEKYVVQKSGIPLKQLHNYDIGGPYSAFDGAINFYREIDRLVNGSVWSLVKAPWEISPELSATYNW